MAGSIKGIIVEIGGDTSGLQKALSKVNSATSSLSRELRGINSLLKLDPKNTELLAQKQQVLNENIKQTSDKLKQLQELKEQADKKMADGTEINTENYRALQREIINTENKLKQLKLETSNWTTAGGNIEEIGTKIEKIGNSVDNLGNKLSTRVTVPLVTLGVVGVKSAMEQESAMQQVDNIYGEASDTIKDFAENTAISFNISTKEAYKYAQVYGNLIQSITDDEEENAQYTQDLLKASAVIASSTGRTMEDVMDRIRSGLLGNTEAIEDLGVNVNVALLESTDAFKKFAGDKSWDQLDFQTQQQIRLFGILEQTTKKYGKEINKNTSSNVQELTAKFNNMSSKLNQKLLPVANKLIDKATNLIDKFDDLSDEEAENIIKIGLMVAAAGPLIKILGTVTNVVGSTVKGVGTLTQAIGVMKTGIDSSNTSANNLAKGLNSIISPAGAATIGIAAFTAAVAMTKAKVDEAYKSLTELNQELKNNNEARKNTLEAIEKQRDASLAEINNVELLRKELSTLVDTNGKVKDGYELRTEFILGELNKALDTEYSMTGNIIDNYKNLMSTIDELIVKKKAQIILEANEEKYKEAIKSKDQLYKDYIKTMDELGEKQKRFNELQEESKNGFIGSKQSLAQNSMEMQKLSEEMINLQSNLSQQTEQLGEYQSAIITYEQNTELMLEGGIKNYKKIEESLATTQQNITKTANAGLNERLQNQIKANEQSRKEYALEAKMNEDAKNSIYATNVKKGQENLEQLTNELVSRTSTIEILGEDEINAWKTLADISYDEYEKAISKMPKEMQTKINEITGVVKNDTSVETSTEKLAQQANDGFNNNVDPKTWGKDIISLLVTGLTGGNSQSIISRAASKVAGWLSSYLHFSVPDKGPLSDMDESMPDMIDLMSKGINTNKYKLINSAQILAKDLKNTLGVSTTPINSFGNTGINNKVMENTKTIFTTPQITFNVQELDENKLQQCFNYVNKKFGSQY